MKKLIIFILNIIAFQSIFSDSRILFYLNHPPINVIHWAKEKIQQDKIIDKLNNINQKTPGQINKKILKNKFNNNLISKLGGFLAIYSGYSDYSNKDGQISFPLRHAEPKLYLVITPKINLIKIKGETISHKEFVKNVDKKLYLFEKKQDLNNQFYWQSSEQEIPEDNRISPLSVILLTKPKNIYIVTGDFFNNDNKQIILPNNIYVIGRIDNTQTIINFMKENHYFEPIEVKEARENEKLLKKMIINN